MTFFMKHVNNGHHNVLLTINHSLSINFLVLLHTYIYVYYVQYAAIHIIKYHIAGNNDMEFNLTF